MKSPRRRLLAGAIAVSLVLAGCGKNKYLEQKLPADLYFTKLSSPVSIRRDKLGIPLIEAKNDEDLHFALGYVAASDRLSQMVGAKLMSQGRMAEWLGNAVVPMDKYMRAMNLRQAAKNYWAAATPQQRKLLQRYADGVNAYINESKLPESFKLSDYKPDDWLPGDTLTIIALSNMMLSSNLQEEIAILKLAQVVGPDKLAWLIPVYPDQPLPFEEARKLWQVDLNGIDQPVDRLLLAQEQEHALGLGGIAASNNWAVHKSRTKGGASIVASDPHLPLSLPSAWHFVHVKTPEVEWAGALNAGVPVPAIGYNGHVAWGVTMVMGDSQDIFLERLSEIMGKLHYNYKGKWIPCEERKEVFAVNGGGAEYQTYYSTLHGTLLNPLLQRAAKSIAFPTQVKTAPGLAFRSALLDTVSDPMPIGDIVRAKTADEARSIIKRQRGVPLNYVFADKDNIGWQVSGAFPIRKKGTGLVPSPGWSGDYDWDGYLDPDQHPSSLNPEEGFIGTANNRTVAADFPHTLSSSWYYPERAERIRDELSKNTQHTLEDSKKLQLDQVSAFVPKVQNWINTNREALETSIKALDKTKIPKAREALTAILNLDGELTYWSRDAAVYGAFLHSFTQRTFLDELGPASSESWKAFVRISNMSYSAPMDHLLGREDSPFWDNVNTPEKETKADIIAASLADAIVYLETKVDTNRRVWSWGKLHTYHLKSDASKLAPMLNVVQKLGIAQMEKTLNRGPFPAGGDHTTLNVTSYNLGYDFDTWLVPTMRMIVDFSKEEPMIAMNSTGQSGDPASRFYDDTIQMFIEGGYHSLPFQPQNIDKAYGPALTLQPLR